MVCWEASLPKHSTGQRGSLVSEVSRPISRAVSSFPPYSEPDGVSIRHADHGVELVAGPDGRLRGGGGGSGGSVGSAARLGLGVRLAPTVIHGAREQGEGDAPDTEGEEPADDDRQQPA